jgi:prepilin-type N-terminal cleavage/methylation domain-containing protein
MRTEAWTDGRMDGWTGGQRVHSPTRPLAHSSSRSGLTLIEVLLAVAILGFGIAGMVMAGARCIGVARQARNYQQAREALAQVEVEEPLALVENMERANDGGTLKAPFEKFRWERVVEPIGLEEDYLYQVSTSITWSEEGWKGSEAVVTFVYRPDQKLPGSAVR